MHFEEYWDFEISKFINFFLPFEIQTDKIRLSRKDGLMKRERIRVTDNALPRDKVNRDTLTRFSSRRDNIDSNILFVARLISRLLFGTRVEFSTPARRALVPFEGNNRLWLRLPMHCVFTQSSRNFDVAPL